MEKAMTLYRLFNNWQAKSKNRTSRAVMLTMALVMSVLGVGESSAFPLAMPAAPSPFPSIPAVVDTTVYNPYSYVRFIENKDSAKLTDEEFFDIAGKVVFPINKWTLPKRDSLVMQLEKEVFPLINRDSLELVYLMLRGAASPEGPTRWNKILGERRAETLLNFLKANIIIPDADNFDMEIDIEDYRTLCLMMRRMGDKDYGYVQAMCDQYLPKGQIDKLKSTLRSARQGTLWLRLFREYFPRLRAARVVFFFRTPTTYAQKVIIEPPVEVTEEPVLPDTTVKPVVVQPAVVQPQVERIPRREFMSVKTNLLFYGVYMPGYKKWCPLPNVAIEYYPLRGHFTYGASFDCPWWQNYEGHKYFQVRNYQLESRYYFRRGDAKLRPAGEGAAFKGLYLQGYGNVALFGICFDKDRGWMGEGLGGGLGIGYVMPLSKKEHWRLEFQLQAGVFVGGYDPYQYESPFEQDPRDNRYYYKYYGDPSLFKKRQHRFSWIGPTRVGITLTYDMLYRRIQKKGVSFKPWETVTVVNDNTNE
jgi:hypothetical protein